MTPKSADTLEKEVALHAYWRAREKFERVLRNAELIGLTSDDVKQMLAAIDRPGLKRPKPNVAASKSA